MRWGELNLNWKYALGELTIFTVGVLIALTADNWWTERQENIEEIEILWAIDDDVRQTQRLMGNHIERIETGLEALRTLGEGATGRAGGLDDGILLEMFIDGLWAIGRLNVQMSAYEEIKSSGRLGLIDDSELRRALSRVETRLVNEAKIEQELIEHQQQKVDRYVIETFQIAQIANRIPNEWKWTTLPSNEEFKIVRALLDDMVFQNQVAAKYLLLYNVWNSSMRLSENLDELGHIIKARLTEPRP